MALYSSVDRDLPYLNLADEKICIGDESAGNSYLNIDAVISAALISKADAIHPGSSCLATNYNFINKLEKMGIKFIGPSAELMRILSDKIETRKLMHKLGVLCVPGSGGAITENIEKSLSLAEELVYPVVIKSSNGRGGRSMSVVYNKETLLNIITLRKAEDEAGTQHLYMEKYIENRRHIEVQILADQHGNVIHLGERDCSVQRFNKKFIEETPAINISDDLRNEIGLTCVRICKELKYCGIATLEFLYAQGKFYFVEINPRLQLGHAVTEQATDIDLVKEQIKIAAGQKMLIKQSDVHFFKHAIGCRIYAEHPLTYAASSGVISIFYAPGGPGIRVDSHIYDGYILPDFFDNFIIMLIASGDTRESAISRMTEALDEIIVRGIISNIPLHQMITCDQSFISGNIDNDYLEKKLGIHN